MGRKNQKCERKSQTSDIVNNILQPCTLSTHFHTCNVPIASSNYNQHDLITILLLLNVYSNIQVITLASSRLKPGHIKMSPSYQSLHCLLYWLRVQVFDWMFSSHRNAPAGGECDFKQLFNIDTFNAFMNRCSIFSKQGFPLATLLSIFCICIS